MLPRFSLATPTVADCPFAVLGGAEERLVLLPLLLPQLADRHRSKYRHRRAGKECD